MTFTSQLYEFGGNTISTYDVLLGDTGVGSTGTVSISSYVVNSGGGSAATNSISGVTITGTGLTAIMTAGQVSGTGGWGMYIGRGTPTAVAPTSSLYINTATTLTASTILYGNTNGTATGWVAIT